MLRALLAVAVFGGCWKDPARPPAAPPAVPAAAAIDPCPEQRLREFAAAIDAGVESVTLAPTGRHADVMTIKCPPRSSDDACLAHARANAIVNEGWEVTNVTIDNSGDIAGYEVELDVDGTREVSVYPNVAAGVARAKALQAQGKQVTMIRGEAKRGGGDRVARVDLLGPPGPARRTAKIHKVPLGDFATEFAALQDAATSHELEILSMSSQRAIELVVGCDPE